MAASSMCRILRNRQNSAILLDAKIPVLICDNEGIDTLTARGKYLLHAAVNDAHYEAEFRGDRVKSALAVAKRRGKKLGTRNKKVKGKGAKARRQQALALARDLAKFVIPSMKAGRGPRKICAELNSSIAALAINDDDKFHVSKVQRILANLREMKIAK